MVASFTVLRRITSRYGSRAVSVSPARQTIVRAVTTTGATAFGGR